MKKEKTETESPPDENRRGTPFGVQQEELPHHGLGGLLAHDAMRPGESGLDWLCRQFEAISQAKVAMVSDYKGERRYGNGWGDGWSDSLQTLKTLQRRLSDSQRVADERCKPFPGSETGCGCIEEVNSLLGAHNTKLDLAFIFGQSDGSSRKQLKVATVKADPKVGGEPKELFPPFCPFCARQV